MTTRTPNDLGQQRPKTASKKLKRKATLPPSTATIATAATAKMDGATDYPIRERDSIYWSESG